MSVYHDRTLELLGPEGRRPEQPAARLDAWAWASGIVLPAAFAEWARLGGQTLLKKYSNNVGFSSRSRRSSRFPMSGGACGSTRRTRETSRSSACWITGTI